MNANGKPFKERDCIWLLSVAAAIHVFVLSAAFPFFNNVDEAFHFDLILKYSHGEVPRKLELISTDSAGYLALMNCHEYFGRPDQYPDGRFPAPAWTLPPDKSAQDLAARSRIWQAQENYEVSQAPLYYALSGLWRHLGSGIGFHGGRLVYWLRFLNIALITALVWLAYVAARNVFPDNLFARLAAPALVAFMPQTAFYSLGNDMLSALCFGITFLLLLKWLTSEIPSPATGAGMGLAFAGTYLAKLNNVPLLAVAATAMLIRAARLARNGKGRALWPGPGAFVCAALPPILLWMMWCQTRFGSLTGSNLKTRFLGWTLKPFGQWWHHPIFTPGGFWIYLSGQFRTFWEGEFTWHHQLMALPGTGFIYATLSLALLVPASFVLFQRHSKEPAVLPWALGLGLACFAAELGLFAWLSIVYDYHDCPAPSRAFPYFIAGRLLLGALVPFLLALVYGMDRALMNLGIAGKLLALSILIGLMLAVEVATDWPALNNDYNWFHLP